MQFRSDGGDVSDLYIGISAPTPERIGAWCEFKLIGGSIDILQRTHGVDEMQAMIIALDGIRSYLDPLGAKISFLGIDDFSGIPKIINAGFGVDFVRKSEALIDEEFEKLQDELTAKRLSKS